MSHRLGAVSSDYCSVCQNGLLPSAAATASNPLWPLAAPFLMTNCQPAPTKARLKCQHRMTKGPRGSWETNCVQYELILYSRAGAWRAAGGLGCWLHSERMQGWGRPRSPLPPGPVAQGPCGEGLTLEEEPSAGCRLGDWRLSVVSWWWGGVGGQKDGHGARTRACSDPSSTVLSQVLMAPFQGQGGQPGHA